MINSVSYLLAETGSDNSAMMNISKDPQNNHEDYWQARGDLFVAYQATISAEQWTVTYAGSQRHYRLTNSQYQTLVKLEAINTSSIQRLPPKIQEYLIQLAKIGIIRFDAKAPHPKPSEATRWDSPVSLAHWALKAFILAGRWPLPNATIALTLADPCGCYVCLKREGQLRGCFGSITPRLKRLADDVVQNTVAASCWDHRFVPVEPQELDKIEISVDIIKTQESVRWPLKWDPRVYGIQLRRKTDVLATLLPDLEGITNSEQQFEVALEKAGLIAGNQVEIIRFTTQRVPASGPLPLRPLQEKLAVRQDDQKSRSGMNSDLDLHDLRIK